MMASGFELINLAATVAEPPVLASIPESSDDGLDPNEFLSQSNTFEPVLPGSRNHTVSPIAIERLELTPTILNSEFIANLSRLSDSDAMLGSVIADSFHFISADSMYRYTHDSITSTGESPLKYLQAQNDSLHSNMRKSIKALSSTLQQGDDCTNIRSALTNVLDLLSENFYLLHEIYNKELSFVNALLKNFETWDRRRSKVLRRIQSIKSEDNKHGTKLAGLLNKRSAIDDEINQLESRIAILKENRGVINKEIEESSSVLESKSAKYVNLFRDLERQGKEAISEYLYSSGLPEQHLEVLLKSEPVEATFSYAMQTTSPSKKKVPNIKSSSLPDTKPSDSAITTTESQNNDKLTASTMGMPALELLEEDPGVPQSEEETAYAKGYAKGTEQLEKLRRGLNNFVTHVFPRVEEGPKRTVKIVDDALNTITEKIDLVPITELLSHKMEALSSLTFKTSKLSAEYHDQSEILKNAYRSLESNERTLVNLLSESLPSTDELVRLLMVSYAELKRLLQSQIDQQISRPSDAKTNYLSVVFHHELTAVAHAISALTQQPSFEEEVPQLDNSVLEASSLGSRIDPRINYKITATGYHPPSIPTTFNSTTSPSGYNASLNSPFTSSSKGVKNE